MHDGHGVEGVLWQRQPANKTQNSNAMLGFLGIFAYIIMCISYTWHGHQHTVSPSLYNSWRLQWLLIVYDSAPDIYVSDQRES